MKNKHLSQDDRLEIEKGLKEQLSFKQIGVKLGKDCTTISKEIRNHVKYENSGATGRIFFDCKKGTNCSFRERGKKCNFKNCEHYEKKVCEKLSKPPYVCNGCHNKFKCTLTKKIYDGIYANKEYASNLKEAREGITYNEEEINRLNEILIPLVKEKKQSIHHAVMNNKNLIMCSEKEIYNLIDNNILKVKNIDLVKKVRYRKRRKKTNSYYKIDKNCLNGRIYADYLKFLEEHPDTPVVEMDSVEGVKGGKVILTLHFVNCSFQLAILREHNDAQSVIDFFNILESQLGIELFKKMFVVILTDNGSEFSNPKEIEFSPFTGEQRCRVFYCEPKRSDQKGSCENNHEFIRRVLPKGTSFDNLQQKDFDLLMSHINSYKRKKLNDQPPFDLFSLFYGKILANQLGIKYIEPNDINLSEDLLRDRL